MGGCVIPCWSGGGTWWATCTAGPTQVACATSHTLWHVWSVCGGVCDGAWCCACAAALIRAAPHSPCSGALAHAPTWAVRGHVRFQGFNQVGVEGGGSVSGHKMSLLHATVCLIFRHLCDDRLLIVSGLPAVASGRLLEASLCGVDVAGHAPICVPLGLLVFMWVASCLVVPKHRCWAGGDGGRARAAACSAWQPAPPTGPWPGHSLRWTAGHLFWSHNLLRAPGALSGRPCVA